jgi:hypothetical protein
MAGLQLMVERRRRHGRPAPETTSDVDRQEFETTARDLLGHLRRAFRAQLGAELLDEVERVEAGASGPQQLLAGQVLLARRLPDYWQRFETYRTEYAEAQLQAPAPRGGWLARLFGH